MSITTAMTGLKTALEALGLSPSPDSKDADLFIAGAHNFDSSFLLSDTGEVSPVPELVMEPDRWQTVIEVQVGVEMQKDGDLEARVRLNDWSQKVQKALVYGSVNDCLVVRQENSGFFKSGKQLKWTGGFLVRFSSS